MSQFNLDATAVGGCLSTVQRVAIKNALYKLQIQERLDAVQFWGKVYGTQQDYFIAVSTALSTNVTKRFYYRSALHRTTHHAALPLAHPPAQCLTSLPLLRLWCTALLSATTTV